jgi:hypothetical protein
VWNNAAFIDRMKIQNVVRRFFFCFEKAAVFKNGTEGQTGHDQKGPGILLFYVRRNKRRPTLVKSELR